MSFGNTLRVTPDLFNALVGIGTSVNYHPIIGGLEFQRTRTRGAAFYAPSGEAVIFVEGVASWVSLDAIEIDPDVLRYMELGQISMGHPLACICADCLAFITQGDLIHARGLQA